MNDSLTDLTDWMTSYLPTYLPLPLLLCEAHLFPWALGVIPLT